MQSTLQLMGRAPTEAADAGVAREVCQRAGAKAMLGGTIAALGTSYVVTLNAQNCESGEVLAEEQVEARSKEEVITALGSAATGVPRDAGRVAGVGPALRRQHRAGHHEVARSVEVVQPGDGRAADER